MSKISLSPHVSGTGNFTIASPNSNTDRTLTLPDNTGTILTSASNTGFPAGSVLQVVSATYSTETSYSTNVLTDTGLTASITPSSSSNKILVLVNQNGLGKDSNNTYQRLALLRGSTIISYIAYQAGQTNTTATNYFGSVSSSYLDSPSTTSSVTYKTQTSSGANSANVYCQLGSAGPTVSTITLLEIKV